ncbi:hypothetical protein C8R45DRAFT_368273 [Mycena sanguinolenta]|nr:hypothetical protein C8R45DRAFT_368273 [Mycena sanguinolenta]
MSTAHPPNLVPTISLGALPQTPASAWAEDVNDLIATHVTATPEDSFRSLTPTSSEWISSQNTLETTAPDSSSSPSSSLAYSVSDAISESTPRQDSFPLSITVHTGHSSESVHPEPTPHGHSISQSTTAHTGHSTVDLISAKSGLSTSSSLLEHTLPATHRDSVIAHAGHSATDLATAADAPHGPDPALTPNPESESASPRRDSAPHSLAAHTGHSSIDLRVPLSSSADGVVPESESAPRHLATAADVPHGPEPAPNTESKSASPRRDSAPHSLAAHTGHSSIDLRVPLSTSADGVVPESESAPRQDSIPHSTTAHTGHSSQSSFALPSSSALLTTGANADSELETDDLLSELSLEFIRRPKKTETEEMAKEEETEEEEERKPLPQTPHRRVSTPLSTTAHTGHSGPAPTSPVPSPLGTPSSHPAGTPASVSPFFPEARAQFVQSPPMLSPRPKGDARTDAGDASPVRNVRPDGVGENATADGDVHWINARIRGHADAAAARAHGYAHPNHGVRRVVGRALGRTNGGVEDEDHDGEQQGEEHRCPFKCAAAECVHRRVDAKAKLIGRR